MKSSRWIVTVLASLIFSAAIVLPAWAEFKLTPSIGIREEYNDNIFLTASAEEDDFITNVNPAIGLLYDTRLLTLSVNYGLNFRFFSRHTERDETRLEDTQRAKLESTLSLYKDILFVDIFDEYARVTIDERRPVALDNIFVNLTDSNHLIVNPQVKYPMSATLKVNIGYAYENKWFAADEGDDMENHTATLGIVKEVTPRITSYLTYAYLSHDPERTEDHERQDVGIGVDVRLGSGLSLAGAVGQAWFDFERGHDLHSTFWNIEGKYAVVEVFSLGAGYSTNYDNSVNLGVFKRRAATGYISYSGDITANINMFRNVSTFTSFDREDRATGVTFNSSIPITPKLKGDLEGFYTYYDFLPQDEDVNRYGIMFSLEYALRIMTVTVAYSRNENDSELDKNDYRNNVVWLQTRFAV
jgi:hypothetical protein